MVCYPDGDCWCFDFPRLRMPIQCEGCLCPACLRAATSCNVQTELKAAPSCGPISLVKKIIAAVE